MVNLLYINLMYISGLVNNVENVHADHIYVMAY